MYVSNKDIVIKLVGEEYHVYNMHYNSKNKLNVKEVNIISFCNETKTLKQILQHFPASETNVKLLVSIFLLFDLSEIDFLKTGLLKKTTNIGIEANYANMHEARNQFGFLGVPCDNGSSGGGARSGPTLVRKAYSRFFELINEVKSLGRNKIIDFERHREYNIDNYKLYDFGNLNSTLGDSTDIIGKRLVKVITVYSGQTEPLFRPN